MLLKTGASFSTCLARAVGINSSESLKTLTDAMAQTGPPETQEYQDTRPAEPAREQEDKEQPSGPQHTMEHPQAQAPTPQPEPAAHPASAENFTEIAGEATVDLAAQAQTLAVSSTPPAASEPAAEEDTELHFPMGAWLGFHDDDTPMMAKLAVHDRQEDNYIFVNREGIKMRELSKRQLIELMDNGLVDILQTESNFRDKVTLARYKSEE
jgi:hypothetical protein